MTYTLLKNKDVLVKIMWLITTKGLKEKYEEI